MIKISILLVVLVIFSLSEISFGRCTNRSKRAENGYILRSCQASVQLTRKYRTNIDSVPKKRTENVDFAKTANAGVTKHSISVGGNPVLHVRDSRTPHAKAREMTRGRNLKDSPFKTIDVKPTAEHVPQIFRKKESLPMVAADSAEKDVHSEPVIYVVESLH